jgi:hypothetical protein
MNCSSIQKAFDRRWFPTCIALLAMVFYASTVWGQEVEVTARIERDTILIGDQLNYIQEVTQDRNIRVWFPEYADTLTDRIEILERSKRDTVYLDNDLLAIRQSYLITSFDSGTYEIPEQPFRVESAAFNKVVFSNPLALEVRSMEIDTTRAIYDIKMPYTAPIRFSDIWPYVLIALLAGIVVLLVWKWLRDRRRKKRGFIPPRSAEPAHIYALRELDRLKEDKLWQNNQVKAYYTRLTEILRIYIEQRYIIRALEETTEEILHDLRKVGFNDNRLYNKLEDLLKMADLVKFARWKPVPEENETALLAAYIFVNETKLVTKLPETDGEKAMGEHGAGMPEESTGVMPGPAGETKNVHDG